MIRHLLVFASFFVLATPSATAWAQSVQVFPSPQRVAPDDQGRVRVALVASNIGVDEAREVIVTDGLTPGATLVAAEPMPIIAGDRMIWSLGALPPGASATISLVIEGGSDTGAQVNAFQSGVVRNASAPAAQVGPIDPTLRPFLAPTPDADATDPEVLARAALLGGDKARILRYVAERLELEIYRGSLRGARGTLWSQAGNAMDRASLTIALLRASGVPARYATASLDEATATSLVQRMFPPINRALAPLHDPEEIRALLNDREALAELVGAEIIDDLIPEDPDEVLDLLFKDPTEDPELIDAASAHTFVEIFEDGAWTPFDPLLDTPVEAQDTAASLNDEDRHLVALTVNAELFNPLFNRSTDEGARQLLTATVPSVSLTGRPLTVTYDVDFDVQAGLVFAGGSRTYTPTLMLGDQPLVTGEAVQETFSTFPGGTLLLTGMFVDLEVTSPGAEPIRYRRPVVDLLGQKVRANGTEDVRLEFELSSEDAPLGQLDAVSVTVAPSWTPGRAVQSQQLALERAALGVERLRGDMEAIIERGRQDPEAVATPEEQRVIDAFLQRVGQISQLQAGMLGAGYFVKSDFTARTTAGLTMVKAYPARPRVVIVTQQGTESGLASAMDIAKDDLEVIAWPGVTQEAERNFRSVLGWNLSELEGRILESVSGDSQVVHIGTVIEAALDQGVGMRMLDLFNREDLALMDIPDEGRARIQTALGEGRVVIAPDDEVTIDEFDWYMWIEIDLTTGEVRSVDTEGRHGAAVSYSRNPTLNFGVGLGLGLMVGMVERIIFRLPELIRFNNQYVENPLTRRGEYDSDIGTFMDSDKRRAILSANVVLCGSGLILGRFFNLSKINLVLSGGINSITPIFFAALTGFYVESLSNAYGTLENYSGFILGFKTGVCVGRIFGSLFMDLVKFSLLNRYDPPLPAREVGIFDRVRQPLHADWLDTTSSGGVAITPPSLDGADDLRVEGALSVSWDGAASLPGGRLTGDGVLVGDDAEIVEGPFEVVADALFFEGLGLIDGLGALSHRADGGAADWGRLSATLEGDLMVLGRLRGREEVGLWTMESGAAHLSGFGPATFAAPLTVSTQDASLSVGAEAFSGLSGDLALGQANTLDATIAGRIALLGLPERASMEPGETIHLAPRVESGGQRAVELYAEGPEGWDILFEDDGRIRVTPEPGAAPGTYELLVSVSDRTTPGLIAGQRVALELSESREAVSVTLTHDPDYTVQVGEVPTAMVLMGEVVHHGSEQTRYALSVEAPEGVTIQQGLDQMVLAPGERALMAIGVMPGPQLPAMGESFEVRLRAVSEQIEGEAVATLLTPSAYVMDLSLTPGELKVVPGETVDLVLTATARGNDQAEVSLETTLTREIQLEGLPDSLSLAPGQTQEIPLRLTLNEGAPFGLDFGVEIFARRDPVPVGFVAARVKVADPELDRLDEAAQAARDAGRGEIAALIEGITAQLGELRLRCSQRALAQLHDLVVRLEGSLFDEVFEPLRPALAAQRPVLEEAQCEDFERAALIEAVAAIEEVMDALQAHDFRLTLTPAIRLVEPGVPVPYTLSVERLGADPTTVSLSLEGVEGEIASPEVSPDPLVEGIDVSVSLDEAGRRTFAVVGRVGPLQRSARASLVTASQWVSVAHVGADLPFVLPGARFNAVVDLFNVANTVQALAVQIEVLTPEDEVFYTSEEPLVIELPALPGLHRYTLDEISTFDAPEGVYAIRATILSPDTLDAVPGGQGSGALFVGQPMVATATTVPALLPPGDVVAEARIEVRRRPANILPGVGNPVRIERYVSDAAGPSSLAITPEGEIYFTSFGTRRDSDQEGFEPSQVVSRIGLLGDVTEFATVPPSPAAITLGPDGALYVANVGAPKRVSRIALPNGEVSTYHDFSASPPVGGGLGLNILGLAFDDEGALYASDFFEAFRLGGIAVPGQRIYALAPDLNDDGLADATTNHLNGGLSNPAQMIIDPRTQDLLLVDTGNQRVVRVPTQGDPTTFTVLASDLDASGLWLDDQFNLFTTTHDGRCLVQTTEVLDGQTALTGEPLVLLEGLTGPLNLIQDLSGNLVTTALEDNSVLRIQMLPQSPPQAVTLQVAHLPTSDTFQPDSQQPDTGVWDGTTLTWSETVSPEADTQNFVMTHALEGAQAGQVIPLSEGTTIDWQIGDAVQQITLPPVLAVVDHLVGLSPQRLARRTGQEAIYQIALTNHRDEPDLISLSLEGLAPGFRPTMPDEVEVAPGETATVELILTVGEETTQGATSFAVRAESALGGRERVFGHLDVTGRGVQVSASPRYQQVRYGQEVAFEVQFERQPDDDCRAGQFLSQGLTELSTTGEAPGIIDWLRQPNTIIRTITRTIDAPPGVYEVQFGLTPLLGCGGAMRATVQVEVVDDQRVTLSADPPVVHGWVGEPVTLTAVMHNQGQQVRRVRLNRCCNYAFLQAEYDAGPHTLRPGQTKRVPIHITPGVTLTGDLPHLLTLEDVDEQIPDATFTATTVLRQVEGKMALLQPDDVTAQDGEASFTVRFSRTLRAPARTFDLRVQSPIGHSLAPVEAEVTLDDTVVDVSVTLSDLEGLAPGPWPVRFVATRRDIPDAFFEAFGTVTIPAGGLEAAFEPAEITILTPGETAPTTLTTASSTYDQAVNVVGRVTGEGAEALDATWSESIAPGQRSRRTLEIRALAPGEHTLTAALDTSEGQQVEADLLVRVLDPADAPVIDSVEIAPTPVYEGAEVTLTLALSDRNDPIDALRVSLDLDGDGVFEFVDADTATFSAVWPDDGVFTLLGRVRDPQGLQTLTEASVEVLNVAPTFVGAPTEEAAEGEPYRFEVEVIDPGLDVVVVALEEAPEGASLDEDVLTWTPSRAQALEREASFTMVASDEDGGRAELRWSVSITPVNTAPSAPELLMPEDGATVGPALVLAVLEASDAEGDPLSYAFEVTGQGAPTTVESDTTTAMFTGLAAGSYVWRANAFDGQARSDWSATRTFTVDPGLGNQPPAAPEIIAPEEGEQLDAGDISLVWLPVEDPEGQALRYEVELIDESGELRLERRDLVQEGDEETLSLSLGELEGGEAWRAKVRAHDPFEPSPWSEVTFETRSPGDDSPEPAPGQGGDPTAPGVGAVDSGCDCQISARHPGGPAWGWLVALALAACWRRRRRQGSHTTL